MTTTNVFPLMDRLQNAINQPSLVLRCQEITQLLHEVGSKDGVFVVRTVIESIFGTSEDSSKPQQTQQIGGGWGLRIITFSEHRAEFEVLRNFLSPTGPLLSLIYRLSHDPYQLFAFPLSLLPVKVQAEIKAGIGSPFYMNKIQNLVPGKLPSEIIFDAFEFYIFHFCHFLVGSAAQRWNLFWTSVKDSLYPTLLEDYLSTYLPCDTTLPPGPSSPPGSPGNILSPITQRVLNVNQLHSPHFSNLLPYKSIDRNPCMDRNYISGLGGFDQFSSPCSHSQHHHHHPTVLSHSSNINFWTSQAFIQILMEVWVNSCVSSTNLPTSSYNAQLSTSSSAIVSLRDLHPSLKDVYVPVGDHIRAVRMMIKHFHYFANSFKPHYPSPLDPMRRNIWSMYRKNLYLFIKHLFTHWPLDSSFRLALETWLSYIQPWRYITFSVKDRNIGVTANEEDINRIVDLKWKSFIAENLLFYSQIFSLLLKRILRLDLASPKNAQILYRVAKVFSQGNFILMINEIEEAFEHGQTSKSFLGTFGGGSFQESSEEQHSPQVLAQIVRSHIADIEKPNYQYISLFGDSIIKDVHNLVYLVRRTTDKMKAEVDCFSGNQLSTNIEPSSWYDSIYKALFDAPKSKELENSVEEIQKCISQLEISMRQFSLFFKLQISESSLASYSSQKTPQKFSSTNSFLGTPEKSSPPEQKLTASGLTLTDYGRQQLLNGLRRMDLKYEGDPDLKPICSYEVGLLVRLFYNISSALNVKYQEQIKNYYYRKDFLGRISRVILRPPETVYEYYRNYDVHAFYKKVKVDLPPRISFRKVAHKKILFFVSLVYALFWSCGFSFTRASIQFLVPAFVFYIFVNALFNTPK